MLSRYRIFETTVFQDDLDDLSPSIRRKIQEKLLSYVYPRLKDEPHYGSNIKKLRNWKPATWRVRIGPWRFFYEIDEKQKIVFMTTMANRKDSY